MTNTIAFVSLGCDKNLVDSEHMLGLLHEAGFTLIGDESEAEVLVVNTCCFIEDAKRESIEQILEVAKYKEIGKCKALIVTGCMAQRYKEEILEEMPEVDAVVGTTSYDKIVETVTEALEAKGVRVSKFDTIDREHLENMPRILTTAGYFAYMKIAEGCDNKCTYCIIPSLRGKYRSRPIEQLKKEAEKLAKDGVSELILVAQDTTLYGTDLEGDITLVTLLRELSSVEGIEWIRILYCYPENITDELIEEIKTNDKVCKYLDIPIQHAADPVLKRMARKSTHAELIEKMNKLRAEVPGIAIRTTLIVGFPGETEEDFLETLDVVDKSDFDTAFTFIYSKRSGTPAAKMEDQVPEDVVKDRFDRLLSLVQEKGRMVSSRFQGTVQEVLVETESKEKGIFTGRTQYNLLVHFPGTSDMLGKYIQVRLDTCKGFYYLGTAVTEQE